MGIPKFDFHIQSVNFQFCNLSGKYKALRGILGNLCSFLLTQRMTINEFFREDIQLA